MKTKFFLVSLLFLCSLNLFASVRFDERIELTAVVCHLNGMIEADNFAYKDYADDVEDYFESYKKHPVVEFVSDYNNKVSIRDLFELALYSDMTDGGMVMREKHYFDRMNSTFVEKYLRLLNDFYVKSKFKTFYASQEEYYSAATRVYADLINGLDNNVIKQMLGVNVGSVDVVLNSFSGGLCYSFPEKHTLVYSGFSTNFLGNSKEGKLGTFSSCAESIFVSNLADYALASELDNLSDMTLSASRLYFNASDNNYYKPEDLFGEYVKNLCSIYYMKSTNSQLTSLCILYVEGNKDNKQFTEATNLYDDFASLAKKGLNRKSLEKFASIYIKHAEIL